VVLPTRILVGCDDTNLYCLDKMTGEELWHVNTAGRVDSTPCVDTPGNCYFGSRDRFFYAVDPEGNILWTHFLTGEIASSPILDEREGRIYVADLANTIYAFTLTGERLWSYKPRLGGVGGVRLRIYSSPTLDDEGYLYVGSGDQHLYAIDRATGLLFWREDTGGVVDSSPVISSDDFLYVANRQGTLFKYLIEPFVAEREIWRNEEIGQVYYGSPTIDSANNIYICGAPVVANPEEEPPQTQLSYIDKETGDILWSRLFPGYTDATPALDEEGNVYLGSASGQFIKVHGEGNPLADTAWPTFHGEPSGHGRYDETFSHWLLKHDIPAELASSDRDSDEDGFRDFEEYVFGTNPSDELDFPDRTLASITPNGLKPIATFQIQKGIRAPYQLQMGSTLDSWIPLTLSQDNFQFEDLTDAWRVQVTLEQPTISPIRFFRVFWQR
jgi:outer membrane protein assembly factor BamB